MEMGNKNSGNIINNVDIEKSIQCFSATIINAIFKKSPQHADRLISRESRWLEFKKSFNWNSRADYTRTCAAFANTKGGYLVFGVDRMPHRLIGLQTRNFEETDPSTISTFFNEYLAPELHWEATVQVFDIQRYGIIYISQAVEKPVVCTKTIGEAKELKEGEIYYRYGGRTSVIRYPELRAILEERNQKEKELWLEYLSRIARIGINEAGIVNLSSGEITNARGTYIVDKKIFSTLNVIKEGEFNEKQGKPAIKIIGEVKALEEGTESQTRTIYTERPVHITIHTPDLIKSFLNEEKVAEPKEYLKAICFESSAFLPMYYFMFLFDSTRNDIKNLIKEVKSTSQSKDKFIQRLDLDKDFTLPAPKSNTETGKKKLVCLDLLLKQNITLNAKMSGKDLRQLLQAIRTLSQYQINAKYVRSILLQIFDEYYGDKSLNVSADIRLAICFLDSSLYANRIN